MGTRVAFKTPIQSTPIRGNREMRIVYDFTSVASIDDNLFFEQQSGEIEYIQSVYIDNSSNLAPLTLQFKNGVRQTIIAQPQTQGCYPIMAGDKIDFTVSTTLGVQIPLIFSNMLRSYSTWGSIPGVLVVPALTNRAQNAVALIMGDNVLVPGIALKTIKLYRGMLEVDNPAVLKFTDGAAGTVLFTALLTAGGALTFQASGVPWFDPTTAGNDLVLNSSAAVTLYGGIGYVQA